jgi:hypothetical protein
MAEHKPARETNENDWPVIFPYFDQLCDEYEGGKITKEYFREQITDKIGCANNYGIDRLLTTIEHE